MTESEDESVKRYAAYIKPYLSAFLLAPLLMLTEVFGEILLPKFMSMIINNGVADRDTGYIIRMGIIMVLTAIVMAAGGIGGAYFSAKASICFTSDLRDALFAKVQNFSFKNIDQYSTGSLVTRLTNDVQQVQNVTMMGLRLLFRAPGMLIGALIMAFLMNAKLALVILIVIPFLSIAIVTIMVKAFPRFTLMQKKIDKLNSGIQEALTNVRVIKSFVREDYEEEKFQTMNQDLKEFKCHEDRHCDHADHDVCHERDDPGGCLVWRQYHHCRKHAGRWSDCVYYLYRTDPDVPDDVIHGASPELPRHCLRKTYQ